MLTLKNIFALTRTKPDGKQGLGFGVVILVMTITIIGGLYVINVIKWKPKPEKGIKLETPNSNEVRRGGNPIETPLIPINALDETVET